MWCKKHWSIAYLVHWFELDPVSFAAAWKKLQVQALSVLNPVEKIVIWLWLFIEKMGTPQVKIEVGKVRR